MFYASSRSGLVDRFSEGGYRTRDEHGLPMGITPKGREVLRTALKFEVEGFVPADLKFDSSMVIAVAMLETEGLLIRSKTVTGVRYWITETGIVQANRLANVPA